MVIDTLSACSELKTDQFFFFSIASLKVFEKRSDKDEIVRESNAKTICRDVYVKGYVIKVNAHEPSGNRCDNLPVHPT